MPRKTAAKPTTAKATAKKAAPERKTKPPAKVAAAKKLAQQKKGLRAVPAALTPGQKRAIVHQCIAACMGTNDFGANQPLSSIQPGREECVQACVVQAAHSPIIVTPADSEISIAGRL